MLVINGYFAMDVRLEVCKLLTAACGCLVLMAVLCPAIGAAASVLGAAYGALTFVPCTIPLLLAVAAAAIYARGPEWARRAGRALARRDA